MIYPRAFVRRSVVLYLLILSLLVLAVACGGGTPNSSAELPATVASTPAPTPTATLRPADVSLTATAEAVASTPSALASGEAQAPGYTYPDGYIPGTMVYGDEAKDRIAPPETDARTAFEAELSSMDADAPTAERVLLLNTTDPDNPSWTYLPGNEQGLYVAVVREGGVEKIDPSLHDWRAQNVAGVELVGWQEIVPPPGSDNVRLIANGPTTVVGAYQGNKLVYWLNTEKK